MFKNMKLTPKLTLLFLVFGIVPMATLGYIAYKSTEDIEATVPQNFQTTAEAIADKIDRNLFERYGDVQAFALNHAIYNRYAWYEVGPQKNAIVAAMNDYVKTYGIYYLTVLVDLEGKVIAVNSVDAGGNSINTAPIYQTNFSDAPFFKAVAAGNFTRRMPFTAPGNDISDGTFIEDLHICPDVKMAYPNDDALTLGFSAPVYENGQVIAYWTNRAKFSLVEEFFETTYADLKAAGYPSSELTLLDSDGRVIVDYDPLSRGAEGIVHNFDVLMKFNLAEKVPAARAATDGETGNGWAFHARKKITQAAGYAHLKGALGYPGMNWSVLARVTRDEAIAEILATRNSIFIFGGGFIVLILVSGLLIGRQAVKPVLILNESAGEIARGNLQLAPLTITSSDEIGILSQNFNDMLSNLGQLAEQAGIIARDDLENKTLDTHISGDLGDAFVAMVGKMKWVGGQAQIIADGDLNNGALQDDGSGTLGSSMATMVRNLRQQTEEREKLAEEIKGQAEQTRQRGEEAEAQRQHVLKVAQKVLVTSNEVASAAEQLSASANQLSQGSQQQTQKVQGTSSTIQEMAASARGVADNTGNLARLVTDNSAAMTQLAASVVSVTQNAEQMSQRVITNSSAIEELAASIQTQAQSADQAEQTAQQANQMADDGSQVVRQAIDGMERIAERVRSSAATINELGKSSDEISTIVAVINDIADQTNLLALNAAIEAARAGEQGRGFAVVAEEVRKLADRTSKATQEIDEKIARIQTDTKDVVTSMEEGMQEVEQGTELAARSGEALEQIGQGIRQVNDLMGQLTSATRDQATTSDEIVTSTTEMNELVQQVTTAMGEQSQAVDVVSQSFDEMQQMVNQVNQAMGEQTEAADNAAQSMEEVNQVAQQSQSAVGEMTQSTTSLAGQAEELKQLASSFESEDESDEEASHNGRDGQPHATSSAV